MTNKKKKMGRPKKPKGELKKLFSIRLDKHERKAVEDAAKKAGESPSKWARKALLKAAED